MHESFSEEFSIAGTMRPGRMVRGDDLPEWSPRKYDERTRSSTPCNLWRVRTSRGMKQSELVSRSGLSQALISNIESGSCLYSRWTTVCRMAKGLGMELDEFVEAVGGIRRNNRMFWSGAAVIAYADLTERSYE